METSKRKCDVCRRLEEVTVCCSGLSAISFAYCNACLQQGLEPYSALISGLMSDAVAKGDFSQIDSDVMEAIVDPSLEKCGRSREGLSQDVERAIEDLWNYE